jgi:PAS domain S-box-containing protein
MQHDPLIKLQQLYSMIDASSDFIILSDLEGNVQKMNRAYVRLLKREEPVHKLSDLLPYIHTDDISITITSYNKWISSSEPDDIITRYQVGEDNYWIHWSVIPQVEDRWIYAIGRDITERKKLENHLISSNKKFSIAFHNSPTINFIVHLQTGVVVEANANFLNLFSKIYPFNVQGISIYELEKHGNCTCITQHMQWIEHYGVIQNTEIAFTCFTGHIGYCLFSGEKVVIDDEDYVLCIMTDITDKKNNDKQMSLLDKYDLLGAMAASIAHEVRNPMTTVKGFLQLLRSKPEFGAHQDTFTLMVDELDRANSIITEYLSLATPSDGLYNHEVKSLNDIINYLLPLLEADILRNNQKLEIYLGPVKPFKMNENEIRQLILNLSRNAIEAMINGGILTIRTYMENDKVVLEVADQGTGIPEELLSTIFTPFFTTKETGTGIGLGVCRLIADHHHAEIAVKSSTSGTSFYIRFK